MSLRKQLEGIKGAKEEEAKKQEEAQKQEEVQQAEQARLQAEEEFRDNFSKRNTLKQALEDFKGAKGDLTGAQTKRRGELKNIQGLIEEIKKENPEAEVPTAREAIAEPEEGSDEERYVQAKEEVRAAAKDAKVKKETLANLGVESKGLNEEELEKAVTAAYKEADEQVRTFVRKHPDSSLPEAHEIRQEIIEEIGERMVKEVKLDSVQNDIREKLAQYFMRTERDSYQAGYPSSLREKVFDPANNEERKQHFINKELRKTLGIHTASQLESYEKMLKVAAPEDRRFAQEALVEILTAEIAGTEVYSQRFPWGGEKLNNEKANLLGKIDFYEVDDELKTNQPPWTLNSEGREKVKEAIDRPTVQEVVEKLSQIVETKRAIEDTKKEPEDINTKLEEISKKSGELEDLHRSISSKQQSLDKARQEVEDLRVRLAELRVLDIGEAGESAIRATYSFGETRVELDYFKEPLELLDQQVRERYGVLEKEVKDQVAAAQEQYKEAKSAKRGWFNKKELQAKEDEAFLNYQKAEQKQKDFNADSDPEFARLKQEAQEMRKEYGTTATKILKFLEKVQISHLAGKNMADFHEKIGQILNQKRTEKEEFIKKNETELEEKVKVKEALESELEEMKESLPLRYRRDMNIYDFKDYFQRKREILNDDLQTRMKRLNPDRRYE